MSEAADTVWADAVQVLRLFAVDPVGCGGVAIRAPAGEVRTRWLAALRAMLGAEIPVRKMPVTISDGRLLGGLDLAATLRAGRPVAERGMLAECDGGVVIAAMAERMAGGTAALLVAAMDAGEVVTARDGVARRTACRVGVVALDEGIGEEERAPAKLLDRLAFHIDVSGVGSRSAVGHLPEPESIAVARGRVARVAMTNEVLEALCTTAAALGVESVRASILALRVACAAAALDGRDWVTIEDAALAARLVLAPRATVLPAQPPAEAQQEENTAAEERAPPRNDRGDSEPDDAQEGLAEASDILLAAARAAIPAGLLARLTGQDHRQAPSRGAGRAGVAQKGGQIGRPVGVRAGMPGPRLRLNLIETLRAAAPWQRLRGEAASEGRLRLRREDFRVTRREQRSRTTTIFVVDASGSLALDRLAEAKGAVELLLADCYQRRDEVAVLAFRGRGAVLLLPPTRSLVRAKRSLATLPGGGGTPLAAGIDAGFLLAESVRRDGDMPTLVFLTDGRANVTLAGMGGRGQAAEEAMRSSRRLRAAGVNALMIDTSRRPGAEAQVLAREMGALYVALPYANAASVTGAIRAAGALG